MTGADTPAATRRPDLVRSLCGHEPPLFSLAADDPILGEVGKRVGGVLSLIDRGEPEAAARLFAEEVALGPGAWDMMRPEDRATMTANAATFVEEQRARVGRRSTSAPWQRRSALSC